MTPFITAPRGGGGGGEGGWGGHGVGGGGKCSMLMF